MSPLVFFLFIFSAVSSLPHFQLQQTLADNHHSIAFRSPGLYPEGIAWDQRSRHFLVGSLHGRTIHAVSSSGAVETLLHDDSLPPNSTFFGLAVDPPRQRLLAVVNGLPPLPQFNALAAYDLRSRRRLFLSPLPPFSPSSIDAANDVTVDPAGNAYVTNSVANLIWKVDPDGEASIFSRSPVFTSFPPTGDPPYSYCGLNGIAHSGGNYLLVVQTNTGKMYRVEADGSARTVSLGVDLTLADDVAVRSDGAVVVVSMHKMWFLKSDDGWGEAAVYDEVDLDVERFPTSVALAEEEERAYVIYGRVREGIWGNSGDDEREWFEIEEVRSKREGKEGGEQGARWVGFTAAGSDHIPVDGTCSELEEDQSIHKSEL